MIEPVPHPEHENFDSLCRDMDEYDSLPSVAPGSSHPADDQRPLEPADERLNDQILAALISP